jgi:RNA polymerase sigma factor (sigma-70 family)
MHFFRQASPSNSAAHSSPVNAGADVARQERFASLVKPMWSQLARYCRAIAGHDEPARDLLAETLALAWEHFDELRDASRFKQYCFRISCRLNMRERTLSRRESPIDSVLENRLASFDLAAEKSLDTGILYQAMEKLSAKEKESILLYEIAGLSMEEVCTLQGGSISGVKSRLARSRKKLRWLLESPSPSLIVPIPVRPPSQATMNSFLTMPIKSKP